MKIYNHLVAILSFLLVLFLMAKADAIIVSKITAISNVASTIMTIEADNTYNQHIGAAVYGDFNGDGTTDLAVCGYYGSSTDSTEVIYVYTSTVKTGTVLSDAPIVIMGNSSFYVTSYGNIGCVSGDFNDDGVDDLVIGSPYYDGELSTHSPGTLWLISGQSTLMTSGGTLSASTAIQIESETDEDRLGWSVANAGDVNDDKIDDIIIGALGSDEGGSGAGAVCLVLGGSSLTKESGNISTATQFTGDAGDLVGYAVSGAGDFDGDGYDDMLIAAYCDDEHGSCSGSTYLFYGSATIDSKPGDLSSLASARKMRGEDEKDYAGHSLAGVGDVNGDGTDDFVVGAPGTNAIYFINGKSSYIEQLSIATKFSGESGYSIGSSVARVGDVNGDGYDDFLIGSLDSGALGPTYLVMGKKSISSITLSASASIRKFIGHYNHRAGDFFSHSPSGEFLIGSTVEDKIWILDATDLPSINLKESSKSWIRKLE